MGNGNIQACKASTLGASITADSLSYDISVGDEGAFTYRLPLSDSLIRTLLADEALGEVCKNPGRGHYNFSPRIFEEIKSALDPRHQAFSLPEKTADDFKAALQWLAEHPPLTLEDSPNPNQYLITPFSLSPLELAFVRNAVGDAYDASSSHFRRLQDPLRGENKDGSALYAISLKLDGSGYDKLDNAFAQLVSAASSLQARIRISTLREQFSKLKGEQLRKRPLDRELIIPDSFFADPTTVADRRMAIHAFTINPPSSFTDGINIGPNATWKDIVNGSDDAYILFREPLFENDVAFLRWVMDDQENKLFIHYHSEKRPTSDEAQHYYVKRDINWHRLTDALVVLEDRCRSSGLDAELCNRAEKLVHEAERAYAQVKEESFAYELRRSIGSGLGFAIGGAILAAGVTVLKGPALLKRILEKWGGPKGPPAAPPSGGGEPDLPSECARPFHDQDASERGIRETGGTRQIEFIQYEMRPWHERYGLYLLGGSLAAGAVALAFCPFDGPVGETAAASGSAASFASATALVASVAVLTVPAYEACRKGEENCLTLSAAPAGMRYATERIMNDVY